MAELIVEHTLFAMACLITLMNGGFYLSLRQYERALDEWYGTLREIEAKNTLRPCPECGGWGGDCNACERCMGAGVILSEEMRIKQ